MAELDEYGAFLKTQLRKHMPDRAMNIFSNSDKDEFDLKTTTESIGLLGFKLSHEISGGNIDNAQDYLAAGMENLKEIGLIYTEDYDTIYIQGI